jgi:hypothetical protein
LRLGGPELIEVSAPDKGAGQPSGGHPVALVGLSVIPRLVRGHVVRGHAKLIVVLEHWLRISPRERWLADALRGHD